MSAIYLDLGCSDGKTVGDFLSKRSFLPELADDCAAVYAFDPFAYPEEWRVLERKYADRTLRFIPKAVGLENRVTELSITENPEARTVIPANQNFTGTSDRPIEKRAILELNFPAWLSDIAQADSEIICKMDIEGAEYGILEKLIETGQINLIAHLFVEFHGWLMPEEYKQREQWIREYSPITIQHWG